MTLDLPILFIEMVLILMLGLILINSLLKNRKRSAESIYKLIDDLEKKYIN